MLRLAADGVEKGKSLESIAESVRAVRDLRLSLLTSDGSHTEVDEAKWANTVAHAKGLTPHTIH